MTKRQSFIWKKILLPLSWPWACVYFIRRKLYTLGPLKQEHFSLPVISVGNLSFGGTGKTPLCLWIAKTFENKGLRVSIVTRGHRGQKESSHGLLLAGKTALYNPVEFGDEPVMMARHMNKGSVIVGKRRAQNLKYYLHKVRPELAILDDGHQHLGMARDLNILTFDSTMALKDYFTPPLGPLREGISALKHADIIVLSKTNLASKDQVQGLESFIKKSSYPFDIPIVRAVYKASGLLSMQGELSPISLLRGRQVIAVAGIARPAPFFWQLGALGAKVVEKQAYPDHYSFSREDLLEILEKAQESSGPEQETLVVTTEKDVVKMRKLGIEGPIFSVSMELEFIDDGEKVLMDMIQGKIGKR